MSKETAWWDALESAVGSPLAREAIAGGETLIEIVPGRLVAAVVALRESWPDLHLTAITAQWVESKIELLYHLLLEGGITLRVRVEGGDARMLSLTPLWPAANWYEREAHDLLGVEFIDHPNLAPLLLAPEWDGPPPMRPEEETP